ncbi:hypothetical protein YASMINEVIRUS_1514 [Yasminevirus sp. GU-2018]|uniref:Uncharacterized protein n=1 Tax=Yasminevirus sp. GU-2018 TaxID=2420051 RepID=A0A5K0UBF5_9VIRU|nr:hypothetical protein YASMINEVIRUS_1514 [Yasminevirus sp. GU-2018]
MDKNIKIYQLTGTQTNMSSEIVQSSPFDSNGDLVSKVFESTEETESVESTHSAYDDDIDQKQRSNEKIVAPNTVPYIASENRPNFEVTGTLDFLPKIQIRGLEGFMYTEQDLLYLWHDIYLVQSTFEQMTEFVDDPKNNFMIVDNLDAKGEWYILKDTERHLQKLPSGKQVSYTTICEGLVPSVSSKAEVTRPISDRYVHIIHGEKRHKVVQKIELLRSISKEVYVCVGIYPKIVVCDYMYHA